MVFFIVTPILVYLGIIAVPFIRLLLTEKWLPAVPYFQLLLMSGIFFPIHRYNLNICNLKGRSDMVLKLSLLKNLLLFIGAFSAISFGIYGLLICLVLINILMTFISAHFSGSLIELGLKIQMNNLYPILVLNIIMGTAFFVIQSYFEGFLSDLFNIMLLGLLFFVLYFLSAYVLKFNVVQDFKLYRKVT
jgi:O-antigen/teichoic acid export membrane protein